MVIGVALPRLCVSCVLLKNLSGMKGLRRVLCKENESLNRSTTNMANRQKTPLDHKTPSRSGQQITQL